jgi:hypothetical protein
MLSRARPDHPARDGSRMRSGGCPSSLDPQVPLDHPGVYRCAGASVESLARNVGFLQVAVAKRERIAQLAVGRARVQRCWAHKLRNIADKVPKKEGSCAGRAVGGSGGPARWLASNDAAHGLCPASPIRTP